MGGANSAVYRRIAGTYISNFQSYPSKIASTSPLPILTHLVSVLVSAMQAAVTDFNPRTC